jgi:hypothetical protein
MQNAPYYAVYNVGDFTFKPWKVIWAEMSGSFVAAVAGSGRVPGIGIRPFVPDHKVYFVAFDDESQAYFLCGILNASIVREFVESHNIAIQVGDIFKHMKLPDFDPSSESHKELAEAVKKAHAEANASKRAVLVADVRKRAETLLLGWLSGDEV